MWLQRAALVAALGTLAAATCYNRDGSYASSYQPCPNSTFCCKPTGKCASNGLCLDPNNNVNGSLANLGNGNFYNETGLYQTAACTNADWTGCQTQCLNTTNKDFKYLWSCDDPQTQYCCLAAGANVFDHRGCCKTGALFNLVSPSVIPWSVAAVSSSTTSSSSRTGQTGTSTNTATSSAATPTDAASTSAAAASSAAAATSGLSSGAAAGIGIGAAVGVILLAAVAFLVFRNRRLKRSLNNGGRAAPSYYEAVNTSNGDVLGDVKGFSPPNYQPAGLEVGAPGMPMQGHASPPYAHAPPRHLAEADGHETYELSRNDEPRELP